MVYAPATPTSSHPAPSTPRTRQSPRRSDLLDPHREDGRPVRACPLTGCGGRQRLYQTALGCWVWRGFGVCRDQVHVHNDSHPALALSDLTADLMFELADALFDAYLHVDERIPPQRRELLFRARELGWHHQEVDCHAGSGGIPHP